MTRGYWAPLFTDVSADIVDILDTKPLHQSAQC